MASVHIITTLIKRHLNFSILKREIKFNVMFCLGSQGAITSSTGYPDNNNIQILNGALNHNSNLEKTSRQTGTATAHSGTASSYNRHAVNSKCSRNDNSQVYSLIIFLHRFSFVF